MNKPLVTLRRPDPNAPVEPEVEPNLDELDNELLGNDGLTDRERARYAAEYRRGAGSKTISPEVKEAAKRFFDQRRATPKE
jgi:hypothetical protein